MRRVRTRYKYPHWNVARTGTFPTVTASGSGSAPAPAPNYGQLYHAYLNTPARAAQFHGQLGETKFFTDSGGQHEVSVPGGFYSGPQQIEI